MTVPESRQGQRPRPGQEDNVGTSVRQATNNVLTELPPPTNQDNIPGKVPVKSALKNSKAAQESNPSASLLDGQFDENVSHNSFLEALNAWRGVKPEGGEKPPSAADSSAAKAVRFEGDAPKGKAGKNFFANIDSKNMNFNMDAIPTFTAGGTEPDQKLADPKFGPKESCWNCFKLYPKDDAITCKISNKKFCKQFCLEVFERSSIVHCQIKRANAEPCDMKFIKNDGFFYYGKWFCGEKCSKDDIECQKLAEMDAMEE